MMPAEAVILPTVVPIAIEPKAVTPVCDLCRLSAAVLLCALLAACIHEHDPHAPRPVDASSLTAERTLAGAQINEDAWPEDNWWHAYGDPQLDALMSDALAGSPTLQVAQARLRQA